MYLALLIVALRDKYMAFQLTVMTAKSLIWILAR